MELHKAEQIIQTMDDDSRFQEAYQVVMANADDYVYPRSCETNGERSTVADAVANQEDALEALDEYRFWRSPHGRRVEADEAWESGYGQY